MESLEARIERLEYYQKLLLKMLNQQNGHFYKMIIEESLSEKEVEELINLCELMSKEYKKQKAEGYVIFIPLLTQFAGLLHPKLEVEKIVEVFLKQGWYVDLMTEFKKAMRNL